ncbi:L-gulonolactone oxidase-like [Bacillus rossius redtenbacheri]|uniref:L-gulonolactone oxidase-like n=1 Tax=Bacillus rossius redtenbacheri TaxID=93214 RepID=UPI002FDE7625
MTGGAGRRKCRPLTSEQVGRVVAQASENALTVAHSAGSFPAVSVDADVWVDLSRLRHAGFSLEHDTITVEAGVRLRELLAAAERETRGLQLYGLVPDLAVADAIAVGLTGSSGGVARCLDSCRVVGPSGEVSSVSWSPEGGGRSLRELVCGLGCLGIVTSATFRCGPLHLAEEYSYECSTNELAGQLPRLSAALYADLYWFPLLDRVVVVHASAVRWRLAYRQPRWKRVLETLHWGWFHAMNWLGPRLAWYWPSLACYLSQKQLEALGGACRHRRNCCFRPYSLVSPARYCRGVRWVLPLDQLNAALLELEDWAEMHPHLCCTPVLLSLQARDCGAAERVPLLAPRAGPSCAVWADWFDSRSITAGFSPAMAGLEALLQRRRGRKCWSAGPAYASPLIGQTYPGFAAWLRARLAADPGHTLRSAYVAGELC